MTSFACPCLRHGGLMFRLISVLPKHMFCSREDQSSASQSFSLPHIMFHLISVSSIHMFQSGEDRSSAKQSFSRGLYCAPTFQVDSRWNGCQFHVDSIHSIWNLFG